jgi:hypothetical protein
MEYKIRKLKWEGKLKERFDNILAITSLGSFSISKMDEDCLGNKYFWSYCFEEYYDEGHFEVKTLKQAKQEAQKYFEKRVTAYIDDFIELDSKYILC